MLAVFPSNSAEISTDGYNAAAYFVQKSQSFGGTINSPNEG